MPSTTAHRRGFDWIQVNGDIIRRPPNIGAMAFDRLTDSERLERSESYFGAVTRRVTPEARTWIQEDGSRILVPPGFSFRDFEGLTEEQRAIESASYFREPSRDSTGEAGSSLADCIGPNDTPRIVGFTANGNNIYSTCWGRKSRENPYEWGQQGGTIPMPPLITRDTFFDLSDSGRRRISGLYFDLPRPTLQTPLDCQVWLEDNGENVLRPPHILGRQFQEMTQDKRMSASHEFFDGPAPPATGQDPSIMAPRHDERGRFRSLTSGEIREREIQNIRSELSRTPQVTTTAPTPTAEPARRREQTARTLPDNHTWCYHCAEPTPNDITVEVAGNIMCEACEQDEYVDCYECEQRTHHENTREDRGTGETVCNDCFENNHSRCDRCDRVRHNEDIDSDRGMCLDCINHEVIREYDYYPEPLFFGSKSELKGKIKPNKQLHFGIELEVESKSENEDEMVETAKKITDGYKGLFYCKSDSSIDHGFEVVSHPFTWDYLKENRLAFQNILKLRNKGYRSNQTTSCGMHIHLSKRVFTSTHILKFLEFFYKKCPDLALIVSQRKKDLIDQWASLQDVKRSHLIRFAKDKFSDHGKYQAVNLSKGDSIEVRIFRGTLNEKSFFKNIEFVKSVFEYTKQEGIGSIDRINYYKYIYENQRTYKNLVSFLKEKDAEFNKYTNNLESKGEE